MRSYGAAATIDAPATTIWSILEDGASYPAWGSGVDQVEGTIADGQRIRVFSSVSPGRAFPVKVSIDRAQGIMTWIGGMPLGLLWGVRTFTLAAESEQRTAFSMHEEFSGPLLGLIGRSIPDLGPWFEQFATALKARAEHGQGPT